MTIALGLLAVLLLTLATGFFVAQEFAYVAADRALLRQQADTNPAAQRALDVTGRLSFMLSGAQLGITVTTLLVGFLAEPAISVSLRGPLEDLGLPAGAVPGVSVAVGVAIATIIQMILGELAPKNLGIARPEPVAMWLSAPHPPLLEGRRAADPAASTARPPGWSGCSASSPSRSSNTAPRPRSCSASSTTPVRPATCRPGWPTCSNAPWSSATAPRRT